MMKFKGKTYHFNYILGLLIVSFVFLIVLIGFFYTPYDPNKMNAALKNSPPSLSHFFGTDNFGRDILSRVMKGAGTTYIIAVAIVSIGASLGTAVGALTGYFGGWFDEVLMRLNDVLTSFPSILLALVFVSVFGPGSYNIIFALGIIFIPSYARVIRSEFIVLKERDFVKNAKLMGAGSFRIMFMHILPNTKRVLIPSLLIGFNNAVLAEAGLSYLGLGVQPPQASLGRMLSEAQSYLLDSPWYAIAPGLMIILTVLGFSLISGGLENE
ncbi:ABC transporter permease [Clostridium thermosuccinogenes]|jgi:peptide/nickel transport system permease protein|uniref:ABC transporter permease n=2 Tax=Clostridium thermosuccinogenes TaxID=84032 RepID=UPI000CCC7282|nr:ABC transporter permease [Pseudoclostridium thermosuccinogenes]PNT90641.1 peptide ABC transporter permease [Pseudoclostridium thermosuccinogenes]